MCDGSIQPSNKECSATAVETSLQSVVRVTEADIMRMHLRSRPTSSIVINNFFGTCGATCVWRTLYLGFLYDEVDVNAYAYYEHLPTSQGVLSGVNSSGEAKLSCDI